MEFDDKKSIYIYSQSAETAPPLGTVLGNIGVNTMSFCKNFNDYTKGLPNYFLLYTNIYIRPNKTFIYEVRLPSLGFFFNIFKFEMTIKKWQHDRYNNIILNCITFKNVIQILKFKFPNNSNLKELFLMACGTTKSMNLIITYNNDVSGSYVED